MTGTTNPDKEAGSDVGLFITIPITGEFADPKPADPKEIVLRRDLYVEDWVERDKFGSDQKQAWRNELASRLAKRHLFEGVIMRMDEEDMERMNEVVDMLQRAVPPKLGERDGQTVIPISKPLRAAKKGETGEAPAELLWRKLYNRDHVLSEKHHGTIANEIELVAHVCKIDVSIVRRFHIADWIALQEAATKHRGKSPSTPE